MKRHFLLAVALVFCAAAGRVSAQTATDATESAEAPASNSTSSAEAQSAGPTDSTVAGAASQSDPSGVAATAADPSSSAASTTATGSADAQFNSESPAGAPPATPAPATNGTATPQAGANAGASAAQPPTSAAAGATIQGQANLNNGVATQQNLSAGLQFGQATNQGLALNSIGRSSFFYNSGLRPGDVLVSYAGRPIRSQADFARWVVYQPGQRVPVVIVRDGRSETIYITYPNVQPGAVPYQAGYVPQSSGAYLGVTFDPQSPNGTLISSVAPGSPAEQAGLRPGQIIVAVNNRRVANHQEVINTVAAQQPGTQIELVVAHRVVLGSRPSQPQAASYPSAVQVESSIVRPAPAPVDDSVQAGVVYREPAPVVASPGIVRPGDADRDGRILDGDGRIGPRERAVVPDRR